MELVVNYNLSRQPFSVGDPITTAIGASIIAGERGCDGIHFIFTYDPSSPVVAPYSGITADNLQEQLTARGIRAAPIVCPLVKAVNVMTHAQFRDVQWRNVWPEPDAPYLFYRLNDEIIAPFFRKTGRVPKATTKLVRPYFAPYVSINLRVSEIQIERNSNLQAWHSFMSRHPDTTFQVIGDVYASGVSRSKLMLLDDLSVIEHAQFHMGTISGPCEMARFGDKPYACFGPLRGERERGIKSWANDRWEWAKPGQRWIHAEETLENIEAEYERLLECVELAA